MILPNDVWRLIFNYLPLESLENLSKVSKYFKILCNNSSLWKYFCKRDFGENRTIKNAHQRYVHYNKSNNWVINHQFECDAIKFLDFNDSEILIGGRESYSTIQIDYYVEAENRWFNSKSIKLQSNHQMTINTVIRHENHFITGGENGSMNTIQIWNTAGKCVQNLSAHLKNVNNLIALGNTLISGATDGTVRIWDIEKNVNQILMETCQTVRKINLYENELITCQDDEVQLWDLRTLKAAAKIQTPKHFVLAMERANNKIVIGGDTHRAYVIDIRTPLYHPTFNQVGVQGFARSGNHLLGTSYHKLLHFNLESLETQEIDSFPNSLTHLKRRGDELLVGTWLDADQICVFLFKQTFKNKCSNCYVL